MMREKYESLPLATLKDLAKARGLKGISTMKKAELIERMLEEDEKEKNQNDGSCRTCSASYSDDYISCALLYRREKSVCRNRCFTAGY